MSVFTPVTRPELETFLAPYQLGRLLDFQGIAAGTENSNAMKHPIIYLIFIQCLLSAEL